MTWTPPLFNDPQQENLAFHHFNDVAITKDTTHQFPMSGKSPTRVKKSADDVDASHRGRDRTRRKAPSGLQLRLAKPVPMPTGPRLHDVPVTLFPQSPMPTPTPNDDDLVFQMSPITSHATPSFFAEPNAAALAPAQPRKPLTAPPEMNMKTLAAFWKGHDVRMTPHSRTRSSRTGRASRARATRENRLGPIPITRPRTASFLPDDDGQFHPSWIRSPVQRPSFLYSFPKYNRTINGDVESEQQFKQRRTSAYAEAMSDVAHWVATQRRQIHGFDVEVAEPAEKTEPGPDPEAVEIKPLISAFQNSSLKSSPIADDELTSNSSYSSLEEDKVDTLDEHLLSSFPVLPILQDTPVYMSHTSLSSKHSPAPSLSHDIDITSIRSVMLTNAKNDDTRSTTTTPTRVTVDHQLLNKDLANSLKSRGRSRIASRGSNNVRSSTRARRTSRPHRVTSSSSSLSEERSGSGGGNGDGDIAVSDH